jgi:predicted TIM-barrel fold metal-dependent hydrolase
MTSRAAPWVLAVVVTTAGACRQREPDPSNDGAETVPVSPAFTGPLGSKAGIPVVDFHAHWDPRFPRRMLEEMDRAGISVAMNYSGGRARTLAASRGAWQESGGRLGFFCNMPWEALEDPDFAGVALAHLRRCREAGALGFKIAKGLGLGVPDPATGGLLAVDDPWLDPIFEEAGRLGLPVAIHTGDPKAFFESCDPGNERWEELSLAPDWCFADRAIYPAWDDLHASFLRLVGRHPNTVFVGVHFGNDPEDPTRVAQAMRENPNLWIDTAARIPEIGRRPPAEVRAVFEEFPDRVLFGTDLQVGIDALVLGAGPHEPSDDDVARFWGSTWRYFETADTGIPSPTPIQGRWTVSGIELPREILEKLYYRNALGLLGIELPAALPHPAR